MNYQFLKLLFQKKKNFIEEFSFFDDWMEKTEEQHERNRENREMLLQLLDYQDDKVRLTIYNL